MATVGDLLVKIRADIKDLETKMSKAQSRVNKTQKSFQKDMGKTNKVSSDFQKRMDSASSTATESSSEDSPEAFTSEYKKLTVTIQRK